MIENKYFDLQGTVMIPKSPANQWRLISNSAHTLSFWGSLAELQKRQQPFEYFVQGQCDGFSSQGDLPSFASTSVYFSDDCLRKWQNLESPAPDSWLSRNRSWVLPVGIALVGGAAYTLKDKISSLIRTDLDKSLPLKDNFFYGPCSPRTVQASANVGSGCE